MAQHWKNFAFESFCFHVAVTCLLLAQQCVTHLEKKKKKRVEEFCLYISMTTCFMSICLCTLYICLLWFLVLNHEVMPIKLWSTTSPKCSPSRPSRLFMVSEVFELKPEREVVRLWTVRVTRDSIFARKKEADGGPKESEKFVWNSYFPVADVAKKE